MSKCEQLITHALSSQESVHSCPTFYLQLLATLDFHVEAMANLTALPYCYDSIYTSYSLASYNTTCRWNNDTYTSAREACLSRQVLFDSYAMFTDCSINFATTYTDDRDCDLGWVKQALDITNGCVQQYCESPATGLGGCPYNNLTMAQFSCDDDSDGPVDMLLKYSCSNITRTVNSDIGGVGVRPCTTETHSSRMF